MDAHTIPSLDFLPELLVGIASGGGELEGKIHGITERVTDKIVQKIECYQEDPTLLDGYLQAIMTPLMNGLTVFMKRSKKCFPSDNLVQLCRIFYVLCKLRGARTISQLLDSSPNQLEPVLSLLETFMDHEECNENEDSAECKTWIIRYTFMIWLSHLLLMPFNLFTISSDDPMTRSQLIPYEFNVPTDTPLVAQRILSQCGYSLNLRNCERDAAALCLARFCMRPDKVDVPISQLVLQQVLEWFTPHNVARVTAYPCLGRLSFIYSYTSLGLGAVSSSQIMDISNLCRKLQDETYLEPLNNIASVRKLSVKIWKNLAIASVRLNFGADGTDLSAIVEDSIQYLLECHSDTDAPVRRAASKALSSINVILGPESVMAKEIVDAIIAIFDDDMSLGGESRLNLVSTCKWQGLVLSLSHLLYKRAIVLQDLPRVLKYLLLTLHFQQQLPAGGSQGSKVRDAACYGLWSLVRRYRTTELLGINAGTIERDFSKNLDVNVLQLIALALVISISMDINGNIRRGAAAALQELVGRHPNTVAHGIELIQIMNFNSVGTYGDASVNSAIEVAKLSSIYLNILRESVDMWQGLCSKDLAIRMNRVNLLDGIIRVGCDSGANRFTELDKLCQDIDKLDADDIEAQHGYFTVVSRIIDGEVKQRYDSHEEKVKQLRRLLSYEKVLKSVNISEKRLTSIASKSKLVVSYMLDLVTAFALTLNTLHKHCEEEAYDGTLVLGDDLVKYFSFALTKSGEMHHDSIAKCGQVLCQCLSKEVKDGFVLESLKSLKKLSVFRLMANLMALGGFCSGLKVEWEYRKIILDTLIRRCYVPFDIDVRKTALKAIKLVCLPELTNSIERSDTILKAVLNGLNDHTTDDRGDIGSQIRLEALDVLREIWSCIDSVCASEAVMESLIASNARLALEKLDKVRLAALHCLEAARGSNCKLLAEVSSILQPSVSETDISISNKKYAFFGDVNFSSALKLLEPRFGMLIRQASLEGFMVTAGSGSDALIQKSRSALVDTLDTLPTCSSTSTSCSLLGIAKLILFSLEHNFTDYRLTSSAFQVIAFLLDWCYLQKLSHQDLSFPWRKLLSFTQKFHYKSNSFSRILLALDVYRGLADIPSIRSLVLRKLTEMLLHPFPRIRLATAETFACIIQVTPSSSLQNEMIDKLSSQDSTPLFHLLKTTNWTDSLHQLKPIVDSISLT